MLKGQLNAGDDLEWNPRSINDINGIISETSMHSVELNWINVIFLMLRLYFI